MGHAIVSYAAYVPRHRLQGAEAGSVLSGRPGRGVRALASYDEDATTLAAEAARRLLDGRDPATAPGFGALYLATTAPPYLDKTNAAAVHAALDLPREGFAVDLVGSPRSGVGALRAAAATGGVAVLSDLRTGLPGSADELGGGDAAAAFAFGPADEACVETLAEVSLTAEFLDRWRLPGAATSTQWEERFGLETYVPLIRDAAARALERGGVGEPDHLVVSCPHLKAAATATKALGGGRVPEELTGVGYAGAADAGLRLAAVLDRAAPGETILLVVASDGADALLLRATDRVGSARRGAAIAEQAAAGRDVPYATYLSWRGLLDREPPRRPEPERPTAPPSARDAAWKFGFVGTVCDACGRVHVPPRRVCAGCGAVDRMTRRPLSGARGTVATFTVDRLAFSPAPPMIDAVVDFDGGGRYTLEVADASPEEIGIGTRLELTFRRLYTTGGVHNYFWKVRPTDG
ncbi:hydroxymethylglutaryl-CoA synthase [Conexibacter sp. W3-3-2]|uniref:OB-fold domain-containing protein n=1 Tax=Conexibacter sp. W3-3-2 TaxID=2675227 RepID=UPI0012B9CE1E|nr:OB-fold domain-containing protein [Conexibacter sp. W3-3-2]MTD44652.1 hydroxymethylglutaryl-CoA synthase [Conexibacter sp. W3-3-2]